MMDQHVLAADDREDARLLLTLHRGEGSGHQGGPGLVMEIRTIEGVDGPQAVEPERTGEPVDVVRTETQFVGEAFDGPLRGAGVDLQADHRQEAAAAEFLLEGQQQVVGSVVVEGQVGITGDPEDAGLPDIHPREQLIDEGHQGLFQRDEPVAPGQREEAGHIGGDLDPGEARGVIIPVADLHPHVEREVGDVGEGMAGIHRERSDHGQDQPFEDLVQVGLVTTVQGLPVAQLDPFGPKGR